MDQKSELEDTFIEEFRAARLLFERNMLKSSVVLYAKSLFALVDYVLFTKYGRLPKNHTERFRYLHLREPRLHRILDSVWSRYIDSYTKPSSAESARMFMDAIREVIGSDETTSEKIRKAVEK